MEKILELPSPRFHFPPGFRFHPSDEELIVHYLHNKVRSQPLPATVIAEVDLYKYNPWELPQKALFGEDEWYFFSPRDRKYPNGSRPNRAAASGYWKATGTDRQILDYGGSKSIGVKKSLVFYTGRPPKGEKTNWVMNEYRMPEASIQSSRLRGSMRLDDWVLCRVRLKGNVPKYTEDHHEKQTLDPSSYLPKPELPCPTISNYGIVDSNMDHLYRHCKVMSSLLLGQSLPAIQNIIPTMSFPSCSIPNSNLDSAVWYRPNAWKSVSMDENGNRDFTQPNKKQKAGENQEGMIINFQPSDSVIDFQEFNDQTLKQMLMSLP